MTPNSLFDTGSPLLSSGIVNGATGVGNASIASGVSEVDGGSSDHATQPNANIEQSANSVLTLTKTAETGSRVTLNQLASPVNIHSSPVSTLMPVGLPLFLILSVSLPFQLSAQRDTLDPSFER